MSDPPSTSCTPLSQTEASNLEGSGVEENQPTTTSSFDNSTTEEPGHSSNRTDNTVQESGQSHYTGSYSDPKDLQAFASTQRPTSKQESCSVGSFANSKTQQYDWVVCNQERLMAERFAKAVDTSYYPGYANGSNKKQQSQSFSCLLITLNQCGEKDKLTVYSCNKYIVRKILKAYRAAFHKDSQEDVYVKECIFADKGDMKLATSMD